MLRGAGKLPLAVDSDCDRYLNARLDTLNAQLQIVDQLAAANDLPDAILTDSSLKITPLHAALERDPLLGQFHQAGHRHRIAHAPQAGQLPSPEWSRVALRELGRIERTLFIFYWLQSVDLRNRVHAGLNKGKARNALARAFVLLPLRRNQRPQLRAATL